MKPILKISDLFKISWKQTRAQIWVLAGLLIGWTIITFTLSIFSTPDPSLGLSGYTLGIILMNIVFALIGCIFNLGYLKNIFQALDGDEPQFSAYGQQARKILTYFIASIIMSIIVCIGFCLLILPGIYLAVRLQYFTAVIVEDNGGIISSLKRSWEITKGNFWPLFLLGLTFFGIAILGILLFVVGIFVAYPLIYMMYAASYRVLSAPLAADVCDAVKIEE